MSEHDFQAILALLTQNYFFSLSQIFFLPKKWFFAIFSKNSIFSKIWYQQWILWLISIPEMYSFIYISVIII